MHACLLLLPWGCLLLVWVLLCCPRWPTITVIISQSKFCVLNWSNQSTLWHTEQLLSQRTMNIQRTHCLQWSMLLVINKHFTQPDTAEFVDEALAVPVSHYEICNVRRLLLIVSLIFKINAKLLSYPFYIQYATYNSTIYFVMLEIYFYEICCCGCVSSRDSIGCHQSVWEHTVVWKWNHPGLSWSGNGWYGSSCVCSRRGGLQKDDSVRCNISVTSSV